MKNEGLKRMISSLNGVIEEKESGTSGEISN